VTRVVVHIGAERTGTEAIHRGLFANQDVLAQHDVLVPVTGRHELSPRAVRHHLLPWSLDPTDDRADGDQTWADLATEIEQSSASTVLLSSGQFAPIAADPARAAVLLERLRALAEDVTVVFFAREQLGLLNSLYCNRVKMFDVTSDFDTYVESSSDSRLYDLESFAPWYVDGSLPFVAVPWDPTREADSLADLLAAASVPIDSSELRQPDEIFGEELGPVGIEATRLLGAVLRGRFPDFSPDEPAARRLRRRASTAALAKGWLADEFWGWSPRRADQAVAHYAESNQEFARRTWGGDWGLSSPLDRRRTVVDLVELDPEKLNRVHRFVNEMARMFPRLRSKEAAI
jgi:hypothetical protein